MASEKELRTTLFKWWLKIWDATGSDPYMAEDAEARFRAEAEEVEGQPRRWAWEEEAQDAWMEMRRAAKDAWDEEWGPDDDAYDEEDDYEDEDEDYDDDGDEAEMVREVREVDASAKARQGAEDEADDARKPSIWRRVWRRRPWRRRDAPASE